MKGATLVPPSGARALRKFVADLARLPKADLEAVLSDLAPAQQMQVRALLGELAGRKLPEAAAGRSEARPPSYSGLSPWMLARLDPPGSRVALLDRLRRPFIMTTMARQALALAAAEFRSSDAAPRRGGGLVDWAQRWLEGPAR